MTTEFFAKIACIEKMLSSNLAKIDKITQASKQLSGLDITDLPLIAKRTIEGHLIIINQIVSKNRIKTFDDYRWISEKHLNQIVNNLKAICQCVSLHSPMANFVQLH